MTTTPSAPRSRGAPCPSPARSPARPPNPLPDGRSALHGASTRAIDPGSLDCFMAVYGRHLAALVRRPSIGYAYGPDAVPGVVVRMRTALASGRYNLDGMALRGTCRTLGLRPTRRAIDAYLSGQAPRGTV
ncbi:hypothetical protein MASR1M101_42040 [Gemmatimonas sp.]